MATPRIQKLIDKLDSVEIVRDQIAGILEVEQLEQRRLAGVAGVAGKTPSDWALRVFVEATNPWEQFRDPPKADATFDPLDFAPIVNVGFEKETFDPSKSDASKQSHADAVINIDCWGYGITKVAEVEVGQSPGDTAAALEAMRAARLVRNILMASSYTHLGLRGLVGRRFVESIKLLRLPPEATRAAVNVACAEVALGVSFNEFSPQYEGQPFEGATVTVERAPDGRVLFVGELNVSTP